MLLNQFQSKIPCMLFNQFQSKIWCMLFNQFQSKIWCMLLHHFKYKTNQSGQEKVISGADPGFSQAPPPPWTLFAWRHPPSENWKRPPLLDIHKHTHPLGHCPCDVIHRIRRCRLGLQAKKGGGSNFGPNVKKPTSWPKRGGGPDPLDPPPPGSATESPLPVAIPFTCS